MLLPLLQQNTVHEHFLLINVFRQELGHHYPVVAGVLQAVRRQVSKTTLKGVTIGFGQSEEKNPKLGHSQDFFSKLLQCLDYLAAIDREFELTDVNRGLVLWTKVNDLLPVEQKLELFLPLHGVMVLQFLVGNLGPICLDFFGLEVLFENELEFLEQASPGELRWSELQVFLN